MMVATHCSIGCINLGAELYIHSGRVGTIAYISIVVSKYNDQHPKVVNAKYVWYY